MNSPVYNDNLSNLFARETKLLDVRSEIEFAKGSIPHSVNTPILSTEERKSVGISYKTNGQSAATKLGHELVSGEVKRRRIEKWIKWAYENPDGALFCWRGGQRSKISQEWMEEAGVVVPRIPGGYKALRRHLLGFLQRTCRDRPFVVIAGETGAGKTKLLRELRATHPVIDLEMHARHRGSAFGNVHGEQPSQQTFENAFISELITQIESKQGPILLEAESRMIGCLFVPDSLMRVMKNCPVVALKSNLEDRTTEVFNDYVADNPVTDQSSLADYLENSLNKLSKKLGHERTKKLKFLATSACSRESEEMHRNWIEMLLSEYYDPYYTEYLRRAENRIAFTGNYADVRNYLSSLN